MATRRSRLQIKPNILGGIKPPSTKTSGKVSENPKTVHKEAKEPDVIKSPKLKSPTRTTSPRKSVSISKQSDSTSTETSIVEVQADVKNTVVASNTENVTPEVTESNTSENDASKSDKSAPPTRARIRKFGKVNVAAARGVKPSAKTSADENKVSEVADVSNKSTEPEKVSPLTADNEPINDEKEASSKVTDNSKNSIASTTAVQRRSRFPKAKPNIADIGRRKQRTNDEEKSTQSKVQSEDSLTIPEITITDTDNRASGLPSSEAHKQQVLGHHHGNQVEKQTVPAQNTSSVFIPPPALLKSPMKAPLPIIPVSPEKRSRTVSMTEPVVMKRPKKPKIDAPTDQPPDRSKMKMKDLIRWNPSSNPMKVKESKTKQQTEVIKEKENVRKVLGNIDDIGVEKSSDKTGETTAEVDDDALPVPQVTIGPDGNIVINETSLVVKGPEKDKLSSQDDEIIDETDTFTTYGSFRKNRRAKRWTDKDTKKFYKALAMIGIDFFLICQLFPDRSRLDIKKKFQKEEKINRALVEKVLKERINFDPTMFDESDNEASSEEEIVKKPAKSKTQKKPVEKSTKGKKTTEKPSRLSRKRKKPSYYDDDTSDEEETKADKHIDKIPMESDEPWQPPSVSQKDGEVVGILMDMSEGRLNNEGPLEDGDETFIATPLHTSKTTTVSPSKSSNSNNNASNLQTLLPSANIDPNKPAIGGIPIGNLGALQNLNQTSSIQISSSSNNTTRNIMIPGATGQQSSTIISNMNNTLLQGVSLSSLQGQNMLQKPPGDDNDQYVLVTVVPEGGGETVIHVYRLHGGVDGGPGIGSPTSSNLPQVLPASLNQNATETSTTSNLPQVLPSTSKSEPSSCAKTPVILPVTNS